MPLRSGHSGGERRARVRTRALVVDDDVAARIETRLLLELLGYLVDEVSDGLEAIGLLDLEGPRLDLVVLDYHMPYLSGLETVQSLRALQPEMGVLLCVPGEAFPRMEPMQEGMALLAKPFTLEALSEALERVQHGAGRGVTHGRAIRSHWMHVAGHLPHVLHR